MLSYEERRKLEVIEQELESDARFASRMRKTTVRSWWPVVLVTSGGWLVIAGLILALTMLSGG